MTQKSHAMTLFEWALLLTLAFVWGGSFFFAAVAVVEIPPMTVAWVRVSGAAMILFLALRVMGQTMRWEREVWVAFFFMGLVNNAIPFSLIFWAQTELASGVASILNAMTPVFTVLAAHFLTSDERMTAPRLIGVALGFVGVFVLIGTPVGGSLLAHLAVLGAAVSYAFASIFGKRFTRLGVKPMVTATGQVSAFRDPFVTGDFGSGTTLDTGYALNCNDLVNDWAGHRFNGFRLFPVFPNSINGWGDERGIGDIACAGFLPSLLASSSWMKA